MRTPRSRTTATAALVLVAAVAAGSALGVGRSGSSASRSEARALVKLRATTLGRVLVAANNRTLYLFEADTGRRSACYGRCAKFWPPLLTTGKPRPGAGVKAALLGTTKRRDGRFQVTYRGHPLYFFVKDAKAGQTLGQGIDGFGAEWYVLDRAGRKVERKAASSGGETTPPTTTTSPTTTTPPGGGYGGGYE